MKKLELKLAGMEMLTKEQMKKVVGGVVSTPCVESLAVGCEVILDDGSLQNYSKFPCEDTVNGCQDFNDLICLQDPCCNDIDCGAKN